MMLDQIKRYWPLWLAIGLLLLVVYMPARVLLPVLPPALRLDGVTGTVWHGRAARASVQVNGQLFMLGGVDWQLQPTSLLLARPTVQVSSRWGAQRIDGLVGTNWRGDLRVRDLEATVDVGWTRQLLPLYVEGQLRLDVARLELRGDALWAAEGRLVWERAAWAARAGSLPLGTYAIDVAGDEGVINGEVVTLNGGLQAAGTVAMTGSDYALDLRLSGPAMQNDGLRQSMTLFAIPDGDAWIVDLRGSL